MNQTSSQQHTLINYKELVNKSKTPVKSGVKNKKRIQLGVNNYQEILDKNEYFVDKTAFIGKLEQYKNPVFLRNDGFGKSMWCSILSHYYDINRTSQFQELFDHTKIGENPTELRNKYMILHLDFSIVDVSNNIDEIEKSFDNHCNHRLRFIAKRYGFYFKGALDAKLADPVSDNLNKLIEVVSENKLPQVYVIIDNYDAFSNQLMRNDYGALYPKLIGEGSFLKKFFKLLSDGYQKKSVCNIFITGELPITIDDMYPEYDIGSSISPEPGFSNMLGFSQSEIGFLMDQIYEDYNIAPDTYKDVIKGVKNHFVGLTFTDPEKEKIYNPTVVMYFLRKLSTYKKIPAFLSG